MGGFAWISDYLSTFRVSLRLYSAVLPAGNRKHTSRLGMDVCTPVLLFRTWLRRVLCCLIPMAPSFAPHPQLSPRAEEHRRRDDRLPGGPQGRRPAPRVCRAQVPEARHGRQEGQALHAQDQGISGLLLRR